MTEITIPDSVTSIGYRAFDSCENLKNVYISDLESWCKIEFVDGFSNPLHSGANLYANGELATEITIPNSVTSIERCCFVGCTSLTKIMIPDSVTSIGSAAFFSGFPYCVNLTEITIPDSVTSIGNVAFGYCKSLTKITIPNSVESIGDSAFLNCSALTEITIPDSVTSIRSHTFYNCTAPVSYTHLTLPTIA